MTIIKTYTFDTLITPLRNRLERNENEIRNSKTREERKIAREEMEKTYQTIDRIISLVGADFLGEMEHDKNLSIQLNEDLVNEVMAF